MNSFAERVECPIVMTINGVGDAHSFMPDTHRSPVPGAWKVIGAHRARSCPWQNLATTTPSEHFPQVGKTGGHETRDHAAQSRSTWTPAVGAGGSDAHRRE
jgi:hypothetical protein